MEEMLAMLGSWLLLSWESWLLLSYCSKSLQMSIINLLCENPNEIYTCTKITNLISHSKQSQLRLSVCPYGTLWIKHDFCMDLLSMKERHALVTFEKWGIDPHCSILEKFAFMKLFARRDTRKGTVPMWFATDFKIPLLRNSCSRKEVGSRVGIAPGSLLSTKSLYNVKYEHIHEHKWLHFL